MFQCFDEQQQGVLCSCECLLCVLSLSLDEFAWLSFLTIVLCAAYRDNMTRSHRNVSEMPSGGYLCFLDILHQTISSTVYKARLHGANKSNRSQDMCSLTSGSSSFSLKHVRIQ